MIGEGEVEGKEEGITLMVKGKVHALTLATLGTGQSNYQTVKFIIDSIFA